MSSLLWFIHQKKIDDLTSEKWSISVPFYEWIDLSSVWLIKQFVIFVAWGMLHPSDSFLALYLRIIVK